MTPWKKSPLRTPDHGETPLSDDEVQFAVENDLIEDPGEHYDAWQRSVRVLGVGEWQSSVPSWCGDGSPWGGLLAGGAR